jgi:hypothetical protein
MTASCSSNEEAKFNEQEALLLSLWVTRQYDTEPSSRAAANQWEENIGTARLRKEVVTIGLISRQRPRVNRGVYYVSPRPVTGH